MTANQGKPSLGFVRAALATLALAAASAGASPYTPASDAVVLEILPVAASALDRDLGTERRALASSPRDLARATRLAWRYVDAARATGDPRYAGLAEGVLRPWLASASPPDDVRLLRATLRQNRHDFAGASRDLDALLARDPRNAQAWLTRAAIAKVRGDLAGARASCLPLLRVADALSATTCLADVAGASGRARSAERALARIVATNPEAPPPQRQWALVTLAEIRARLGETEAAEAAFREALTVARDSYSVAAYADFLLDAGRPRDVLTLLGDERRADGLLLRRALAERRLGAATVARSVSQLSARFAAARLRGERLHAGEESRFALAFGDPREALALARDNFAVQREPRDARALMEAALAMRDPNAAAPALAFLSGSGLEDVQLRSLAQRLEALR